MYLTTKMETNINITILVAIKSATHNFPIFQNNPEGKTIMQFKKIRNFFNPLPNTHIHIAGDLSVFDTIFTNSRNPIKHHKQGLICKTKEEAELLNEFLLLTAKVWQFAVYGTFANPEILNLVENIFTAYIDNYEQPIQGELFPCNNVLEWSNHRDEIDYNDYRTAYFQKVLKDFSPIDKIKWGKKLGIKL